MTVKSLKDRVLELADGKRTAPEIAAITGCALQTVYSYTTTDPSAFLKPVGRPRYRHSSVWTEERVAKLKKLWAEGLSATDIAARLRDVSRNAVIGKVHRMGLDRRGVAKHQQQRQNSYGRHAPATQKRKAPTSPRPRGNQALRKILALNPEPNTSVRDDLIIPAAERKSLLDLEECHCRWPIGDPQDSDFGFCGMQKVAGTPYCEHHAKIAFCVPQPRRRKDPPFVIPENAKQFESA